MPSSLTIPNIATTVKWTLLTLAFLWLVGCTTMHKKPDDGPFPGKGKPDEFSCGERHH